MGFCLNLFFHKNVNKGIFDQINSNRKKNLIANNFNEKKVLSFEAYTNIEISIKIKTT